MNLFICHSFCHPQDYQMTLKILKESGISFHNYSCTKDSLLFHQTKPCQIRRKLRGHLLRTDVMVALLGDYYQTSKWMRYETKIARKLGVPIIGVSPHAALSKGKRPRGIAVTVGLGDASLIQAIRQIKATKKSSYTVRRSICSILSPGRWVGVLGRDEPHNGNSHKRERRNHQ